MLTQIERTTRIRALQSRQPEAKIQFPIGVTMRRCASSESKVKRRAGGRRQGFGVTHLRCPRHTHPDSQSGRGMYPDHVAPAITGYIGHQHGELLPVRGRIRVEL